MWEASQFQEVSQDVRTRRKESVNSALSIQLDWWGGAVKGIHVRERPTGRAGANGAVSRHQTSTNSPSGHDIGCPDLRFHRSGRASAGPVHAPAAGTGFQHPRRLPGRFDDRGLRSQDLSHRRAHRHAHGGRERGPGRDVYASQALGALINGQQTVIPSEAYYPLDTTREDVAETNAVEMSSSQDVAVAAAMGQLDKSYSVHLLVDDVVADSP